MDIAEYSLEEDFPVRLAKRIQWLLIFICVTMYACFVADNAWVKFAGDILFIVVNVWFSVYTLNPWRTAFSREELEILNDNGEDKPASRSHISIERYTELSIRIKELMEKEEGFGWNMLFSIYVSILKNNSKKVALECGFGAQYAMNKVFERSCNRTKNS